MRPVQVFSKSVAIVFAAVMVVQVIYRKASDRRRQPFRPNS
jgi:hypothetical protein